MLLPVERGAEPETGDGIGDRGLRHALALVLAANGVLCRGLPRAQVVVDRGAERGEPEAVLADAVEQLHGERRLGIGRQRSDAGRFVGAGDVVVGLAAGGAAGEQFLRQAAQVLDQRELEHARPRPQLADGQRRDALVAVEELRELLAIEAAVAVAHQLHGDRINARLAAMLARREGGQRARVGPRQVAADAADLRGDEVEVVEQPVGGGGDEDAAADVVRQRAIGAAEDAHVVFEPRVGVARPMAGIGIDGEDGGERERPFFEPLGAEQLVPQRFPGGGRRAPREPGQDVLARAAAASRGRSTVNTQPAPGRSRA